MEQLDGIDVIDLSKKDKIKLPENELMFNGRTLHFRKWKVKDKFELDKAKTLSDIRKALVYNCLNEHCILDLDEYNYVLFKIRNASVHEPFTYEYECPHCGNVKQIETYLDDVIGFSGGNVKELETLNIKLKYIDNEDLYETLVVENPDMYQQFINDFALHIKSYNDTEIKNQKDVEVFVEYLSNLDVDVAEKLFKEWNDKRFKFVIEADVICENCGETEICDFANLPEFFPASWRK